MHFWKENSPKQSGAVEVPAQSRRVFFAEPVAGILSHHVGHTPPTPPPPPPPRKKEKNKTAVFRKAFSCQHHADTGRSAALLRRDLLRQAFVPKVFAPEVYLAIARISSTKKTVRSYLRRVISDQPLSERHRGLHRGLPAYTRGLCVRAYRFHTDSPDRGL